MPYIGDGATAVAIGTGCVGRPTVQGKHHQPIKSEQVIRCAGEPQVCGTSDVGIDCYHAQRHRLVGWVCRADDLDRAQRRIRRAINRIKSAALMKKRHTPGCGRHHGDPIQVAAQSVLGAGLRFLINWSVVPSMIVTRPVRPAFVVRDVHFVVGPSSRQRK